MDYLNHKEPPKREDRLKACIAYGGTICGLAKKAFSCCLEDGERAFTQANICLLLPALGMLNSLPDNVVLLHGAIGCGSSSHCHTANSRSGGNQRWGQGKDALWLSTALDETDVISGGEVKLSEALKEIDRRYRPKTIVIVATCVPGITGDDIEGVVNIVQREINAIIIPVHCEGFKTKIWATAYDAVYHGIGRHLLDKKPLEEELDEERLSRTVNLMNVGSMGRVDEVEQERLLKSLGLEVNVFPVFAKPEEMYKTTQAALSISTCPTHDDYLLKYLQDKYGVPYIIKHMPVGISNTSEWIRNIAKFFGLEEQGEFLIRKEEEELAQALAPFKEFFAGKKAFISAGEFRALATGSLLLELGFELIGLRSYHHDEFALVEYEKLVKNSANDFSIGIADAQPFEEANLLKKLKPDVFLGHWCGNATAAKLGIATHTVYNGGLNYIGYRGAYELARRLYRQLKNPAFNINLSKHIRLPYKESWYQENPFKYLNTRGGNQDE